jgi:catecholate siderophore receptor
VEVGHDGYDNQNYYRNGSCNGRSLNAAGATTGYMDCVSVVNPSYSAAGSSVADTAGNRAGGSANTIAAYVGDTIELVPQFKLVGGLRYDRYIASISNSINSGNTRLHRAGLCRPDRQLPSVRSGAIWQPSAAQSYYVSYGTSFNPSLEQLTGTLGQQNLDPEKNRSYELGGKWDLANGLALTRRLPDHQGKCAQPGRHRRLRAGRHGPRERRARRRNRPHHATGRSPPTTPTWMPRSSAAPWPIPRSARCRSTRPSTPHHLDHLRPGPHWQVGGGATYMSQRYANATNTVQVGGYTRYDAMLAYTTKAYDIRLNLYNLTDKMYYDALIQSDGGRSVPGSGRTALLSLTYRM